jgi:hypothetical protein
MSLTTPTTKDISDNIIAQLEASLNQTIPLLPKAFNRVLAKAIAGVFIILYKYGGFMFLQMFVQTSSSVDTEVNGKTVNPLTQWGRLIGVGDPVAATNAELLIDVTVEVQTGSILSGTQLVNSDNGVTYITIGEVLLNAATVQATIRAVSDQADGGGAGAIGNLEPGDIVSFANALPNVARAATVDSQIVTGADAEDVEVYRQRIIDRFQKRPQGGAYADYQAWGEEVAGIVNVYPYTSVCPGQVDCYVEATPESSGNPDGVPTTAQLEAVLEAIELNSAGLATRRPANALANTLPIERTDFEVRVTGLSVDNPATVQTDITTALEEYFLDREPYIPGLSVPPRKDRITRSALGGVVDDIVSAAGGIFTSVILLQSSVSTELYSLGEGEKAKTSTVTFI